jgi:integrase
MAPSVKRSRVLVALTVDPAGGSLVEVSRRLGHSSTDFTARTYIHVFPDQQQVSAQALDRLIG